MDVFRHLRMVAFVVHQLQKSLCVSCPHPPFPTVSLLLHSTGVMKEEEEFSSVPAFHPPFPTVSLLLHISMLIRQGLLSFQAIFKTLLWTKVQQLRRAACAFATLARLARRLLCSRPGALASHKGGVE
jgi:hypothetical protein